MIDLNSEIQKYVQKRKTDPRYQAGMVGLKVVQRVFQQYPFSTDLEEVLLKVAVLNDLYHTHLSAPFKMARHITSLTGLDDFIKQGKPQAVSQIATVSFSKTSPLDVYIFATKYCFMSHPQAYFIYDPMVQAQLVKYLNLSSLETAALKDYSFFSSKMNQLIQRYHITANHTDLDSFLWLSGHESCCLDMPLNKTQ